MQKISQQQLMCMAFIGMLSPIIRLLPEQAVNKGGHVVWVSPVIAVVPVLIFLLFLFAFLKNRGENEGMVQMYMRSLGGAAGRIACVIYGLWLLFYGGFVLRYSGERLTSSIYGDNQVVPFIIVLLLIAVILASGPIRSVARSSQIFAVVVVVMLSVVILFALPDIKKENIFPVTYLDGKGALLGAEPIVILMTCYFYATFLMNHTEKKESDRKRTVKWLMLLLGVIFMILIVTIGSLSAEIIYNIRNPFFTMVQDISAFGIIDRLEALAVTLWCISDVVYVTVLLLALKELWSGVFGASPGRWYVWVSAAVMLAASMFALPDPFKLQVLSNDIIPRITLIMTAGIPFLIFITGKLRKKI